MTVIQSDISARIFGRLVAGLRGGASQFLGEGDGLTLQRPGDDQGDCEACARLPTGRWPGAFPMLWLSSPQPNDVGSSARAGG